MLLELKRITIKSNRGQFFKNKIMFYFVDITFIQDKPKITLLKGVAIEPIKVNF